MADNRLSKEEREAYQQQLADWSYDFAAFLYAAIADSEEHKLLQIEDKE